MGNKLGRCCAGGGVIPSDPLDEGFGHSFCYVLPDQYSSSKVYSEDTTSFFRSISGASVSANTSTPLSTAPIDDSSSSSAAAFESSTCFASIPLQPVPRHSPITERGFLSGPIERGLHSAPMEKGSEGDIKKPGLRREIASRIAVGLRSIRGAKGSERNSLKDDEVWCLQWAQGKAGEDRMQVVISEEHGWVFVGIYDGFNGPDAPDYLLSNLYSAVHKELQGLLWNQNLESIGKENHDPSDTQLAKGHKRCKCEWNAQIDTKPLNCPGSNGGGGGGAINHSFVLKALSRALMTTEDAYLEVADKMVVENPELALMGSCVLVMLMKGEDVYLMNVGDSRAVLGRKSRTNRSSLDRDELDRVPCLTSFQLTVDHSTYEEEEVQRIRKEHPDDDSAVTNERVKGYLKVTRAFGAGFLKQPKWNDALLEMFRIDYIGTSPYITCTPWLYHHKLGPRDRFLMLSSDGLYQYFTNEEAISEVESFIASFPDGDPAQHLVEQVLFRAAKKAGLDFHELLDIPQGDRRRYHDDVSIIIISLEGRIWRSSV